MKKIVSMALSVLVITGAMGSISLASAEVPPPPHTGYCCSENVDLNVPYYEASKEYYSAPATAVQTVAFLTGKNPISPSIKQWSYANSMNTDKTTGTTSGDFLRVLNDKQDKINYFAVQNSSLDAFVNHIDQTLVQQAPAVVKTAFKNDQYSSQSHYMNVSAQLNMGSMHMYVLYDVTDPMCSYLNPEGAENGTYHLTNYELYDDVMGDADQTLFCCA